MKIQHADFDRAFAAVNAGTKPKEGAQRQTGSLSIERADKCPYCGREMTSATARGHAVYVCEHDRHVVPQEDRGT